MTLFLVAGRCVTFIAVASVLSTDVVDADLARSQALLVIARGDDLAVTSLTGLTWFAWFAWLA